jgi:hypothetical protein
MRDAMNASSATVDKNIDEFAKADLEKIPCETIDCAEFRAHLLLWNAN